MQQKYGDKLQILQGRSPASVGLTDESACNLVADSYERIATLPPGEAGPALRGMLAMR